MTRLEIEDIQGIIRRGYGDLESACFLLLTIEDIDLTKKWLRDMAERVRSGEKRPGKDETCINLAFTQSGFDRLGLQGAFHKDRRFSIEFEDGMITDHRKKILGDSGESDPEKWDWGGPNNPSPHILMLLYAGTEQALNNLYKSESDLLEKSGLKEVIKLGTEKLPGRKEHFGFRDGISQPHVAGLLDRHEAQVDKDISQKILDNGGSENNILAAGEFVLGYLNAYQKYPASPKVSKESDTQDCLKEDEEGGKDFGRNGSYLVFRQLSQHVGDFWEYMDGATKKPSGESDSHERDKLAAKMVGRWRSGCPLVESADEDKPGFEDADDFNYFPNDMYGEKCPIASHVRRTNPRDSPLQRVDFNQKEADVALRDANKHRILRRGRAYGKPAAPSMDPEEMLKARHSDEVGLQFLCFNANIGRQFEFIQHTWINNPKFAELYTESDPLLGDNNENLIKQNLYGDFTAPANPVRDRVRNLKRFVDVKGGAYFFMPGINALKYLANLE